ncbi:hypothetical protein ACT1U9_32455 [Streptomyces sp. BR1]|uniref:hypothetical protein n=1 Tax=Streptomyces sp. BR1 TaxID=1592323 RepID=UPI00402B9611
MPTRIQRVHSSTVMLDSNGLDILDPDVMGYEYLEFAANGIVAVHESGYTSILTEQESGTVTVTAELWDGPPPLALDAWQDAAEISVDWTGSRMEIGDEDAALNLDLPPGTYRLRAHGRNRDDGDVRDEDDPVEEYLLHIWPAPTAPPHTHKLTSQLAAGHTAVDRDPAHIHGTSYDQIAAQRRQMDA